MPYPPVTPLCFSPSITAALRNSGAPIIVTGSGGWLGRAALEMLDSALGAEMLARVTVFASAPRAIKLRSGRVLAARDFAELDHATAPPSLILHFAFLTNGHAAEAGYIAANQQISELAQKFINRNGALGIFIPSSGAVYSPDGALETDLTRNPYGALKHQDEIVFQKLADDQKFPAAIIRIFNLAGPFINNLGTYALASIIKDVTAGGPILLRANHPVYRSYAHIEDVLNIAMAILLHRVDAGIFDTGGEPVLEIGELASRISLRLTGKALPILRPDWQNQPENRYFGDFSAYRRAAELTGTVLHDLDQHIFDTARYLQTLG
jgi:nucleoside-diphosphate-sugar epimerase